jgi:hypothetical protein
MPEIVSRGNLLDQIRRSAVSLCADNLIESLPVPEEMEAVSIGVELGEPIRRERLAGHGAPPVRRVSLAPVQKSEQEPQNGYAIHGVAGRDLTNAACFCKRVPDAHSTGRPIGHQNGDSWLFEQVIVHEFLVHGFLHREKRSSGLGWLVFGRPLKLEHAGRGGSRGW